MKRAENVHKDKKGLIDRIEDAVRVFNRFIFLIWDVIVLAALVAFTLKFILGAL